MDLFEAMLSEQNNYGGIIIMHLHCLAIQIKFYRRVVEHKIQIQSPHITGIKLICFKQKGALGHFWMTVNQIKL